MKRPAYVYILEILLFFVVLAGAFLLLAPVSRKLDSGLAEVRRLVLDKLEESTGLDISYSSMSPSILRSLKIKDLAIRDASTGEIIAKISEVSITYSLREVIAGNIPQSIREIVISNGSLAVDTVSNKTVIDSLSALAGNKKTSSGDVPPETSETVKNAVKIRLSNISCSFRNGDIAVSGSIDKGLATLEGDQIAFGINGSARVGHPSLSFSKFTSAGITLSGSVSRSFDAGTATLMLQSLESGPFSIGKLGLVASYRDGIVMASSVASLQPIDVNATWDVARKSLKGSFECENLLPLKWIRVKNASESALSKLEDVILNGSASIRIENGLSMEYDLDIDAVIPSGFLGGGNAVLRCAGNRDKLEITDCSLVGPFHEISCSGSVDLVRMIPEGFVSARKIQIRPGCTVSGDIYIQGEGKGFACLMPELSINDNILSSVEVAVVPASGSIGFTVSAYDASGHISADGSFTYGKERFLQFYGAFDAISVANTAGIIASVAAPERDFSSAIGQLGPFALTTELYVSTDFSDISFNCTRLVFASAEKDGIYLLLTAKGNRNGVDLTDISFSKNGTEISGDIYSSFEKSGEILFSTDCVVNAIPYAANGTFGNRILSLYGDYGLAVTAAFDRSGIVSGSFLSEGLPVSVGPAIVSVSLDATYAFVSGSDWNVLMHSGSLEEMGNLFPVSSVLAFSGTADQTGIIFRTLDLSDQLSHLTGHASFYSLPDKTYSAEILLASGESTESFTVDGNLSFSAGLHFDTRAELQDIPLMRFVKGQPSSSRASLSLAVSGTPSEPVVSAEIRNVSWRFGDFDLEGHGSAAVENGIVNIADVSASWNGHTFSGLNMTLPLDTFKAHLETDYATVIGKSGFTGKLAMDLSPGEQLPPASGMAKIQTLFERFSLAATISDVKWKTIALDEPFQTVFIHEPGVTAVYAGKNEAITGFLLDDGTFSLQSGATLPVSFHADGDIMSSAISIRVDDFRTDLAVLWPFLDIQFMDFPDGNLEGNFTISGLLNDPEFRGIIHANEVSVRLPGLLGGTYGPVSFDILADGKTLDVPEFTVASKDGSFSAACTVEFDRWLPSSLTLHTATLPGKTVKIDADNQFFKAVGFGACDLDITLAPDRLDIEGPVKFERGSFAINIAGFTSSGKESSGSGRSLGINLDLDIGKKVEFLWPTDEFPIIKGLVQVDEPLKLVVDSDTNSFGVKGKANLRGGEIFYIKRNFYLRQGNITFNENQDIFDPMITLKAEIRERDEEGEPVRIILLVENQPLSTFTPILYSDPPKSDLELMSLLGQATSGDATRETLLKEAVVSASDILTQMSLFRAAENGVRDLVGLDIFSVRTLILQNAILGPSMQTAPDKAMTIGNYFDNTTVYMGKYLGSAIYADALMHFSYYDPLSAQNTGDRQAVYQNLLFQPELGLEVSTPFFLLRWGISPANPDTLFVADNSITLSWKFSY